MAINLKFNKKNLIPTKKFFVDAILIGVSVSLTKFILEFFGFYGLIAGFPDGVQLFIIIILAIYLKRLFDVVILGKDIF